MSKIAGTCLCGGVRYSSDAEPLMTAVCHCTHCQKQTGTAFSVVVGVPKDGFKIVGESHAVFQDIGDSGNPVLRHFCRGCGSPLYSELAAVGDRIFLKAGTLDDTSWLRPQVNIWCDSAQPWVKIDESLPKFGKAPPRRA